MVSIGDNTVDTFSTDSNGFSADSNYSIISNKPRYFKAVIVRGRNIVPIRIPVRNKSSELVSESHQYQCDLWNTKLVVLYSRNVQLERKALGMKIDTSWVDG
jgi:hypothetical protein